MWVCFSRSVNTKVNRLHEQCLWIVYNDKKSNFNELLVKDDCLYPSLKFTVEMFKVSRGLNLEIVDESFQFREQIPYELRQRYQFQIPLAHSAFGGAETLKFLGLRVRALVPNEIKQLGGSRKTYKCNKAMETYILSLQTLPKYIFIGFGFFNKILLRNDRVFVFL